MANEHGSNATPQQDFEARRRRRRKALAYSGAGGAVVAIMAAIYFFFFSVVAYRTVQDALGEVRRKHPNADIRQDPVTGFVTTMANLESTTRLNQQIAPSGAGSIAKEFLEKPEVAKVLGVPKQAEVRVASLMRDSQLADYNVVRMEQFVDSVRLFGADIAVSVRTGPSASIGTVTTRPETVPDINLQPAIDESAARASALKHYATIAENPDRRLPRNAVVDETERIIFDPKRFGLPGEAALAWRTRIDAVHIFVDAKDAHIILSYDDRPSVLNRITHDCNLTATCPIVLNETGPVGGTISTLSKDAKDAHAALATTHAYFKKAFARDGFDDVLGTGGSMATEAFVQVFNFQNAQWVPTAQKFEFGAGWTTLDIAAHEYTHAVTSFGPKLIYFGESGAVNEFFSDFFAAMIERAVNNTTDWRIGEGLPGHSMAAPLRNMANPHNNGFNRDKAYDPTTNNGQPADYGELVTTAHTICGGFPAMGDSNCVHFNSGILSRAMVLAVDGFTVNGTKTQIAREKVEQIMFRTLMLGGVITSSSNLRDTAIGAVTACGQLAQAAQFGITTQDCTALKGAFNAVKFNIP